MSREKQQEFIERFDHVVDTAIAYYAAEAEVEIPVPNEGCLYFDKGFRHIELGWVRFMEVDNKVQSRRGIFLVESLGHIELGIPRESYVWSAILVTALDGEPQLTCIEHTFPGTFHRNWLESSLDDLYRRNIIDEALNADKDFALARQLFNVTLQGFE